MRNKPFYISLIILVLVTALVSIIDSRGVPVVIETNLENIPTQIDGFSSTDDAFSQSVYDALNADKNVYRHYMNSDNEQIDLYIGYYGTAKGGRTPHNPHACFSSAGWGIIKTDQIELSLSGYSRPVKVNYMLIQKGETFNIVFHWYQSGRNKVLSTGLQQNIQRFKGRIFHNRNDGAFVRVSAIASYNDINEKKMLVEGFVKHILSLLPAYWPVEKVQ